MADDFDNDKQRGQPQDRAEKMLEVLETVGFDSVIVGGKENYQGAGYGGIQIIRGGQETRNQPQEVGEEDEKAQGPDEEEILGLGDR